MAKSILRASEDIFNNMLAETSNPTAPKQTQRQAPSITREAQIPVPDISKVEVPDFLLNSILESVSAKKGKIEEPVEVVEEINEELVSTNKLEDLVTRLATLIREAKTVIQEMTTTGMLGVGKATGFKKPCEKKDKDGNLLKNGPTKTIKRN